MKGFFLTLFLLFALIFTPTTIHAEEQVSCDMCGYCPSSGTTTQPSNWKDCCKCIYEPKYPGICDSPDQTLKVNPDTNAPYSPAEGKYYTMIGCLSSDVGSFTQTGAAGSIAQTLLNIVFSLAGGVAFLYLIYGAFLVLTSQADPERLNQGKRIIMGSIVGLIFVFSTVFLVNLLASGILKLPGFGG
ncbi:hypothetical protein HGA88_04685 [Candidatus Roizmanbacteria bacterium]|nr:hypothetical protein [Candidatus Roizmanbacteria bacterium]